MLQRFKQTGLSRAKKLCDGLGMVAQRRIEASHLLFSDLIFSCLIPGKSG